MNSAQKTALAFLGCCIFVADLSASIPEKYQTIVDRNSFGLNPVLPVDSTPAPVIPPSDVKLTGFAQTVGQSKAYFVVQSKDPKEPARYVSLAAGEKEGILELVSISEGQAEVKIKNTGVEMVLSLKDNGFKQGQPGPTMVPPPAPNRVVSAPEQNFPATSAPIYNAANASSVVATYNNNVVVGASPTPAPVPSGDMTMGSRNQSFPATVNSVPQIGLIAGNNSVVFGQTPAPRNPTSQPAQEQHVEPVAQYFKMMVDEQAAISQGMDFPPLPPMPIPRQPGQGPPSVPGQGPPSIPRQ